MNRLKHCNGPDELKKAYELYFKNLSSMSLLGLYDMVSGTLEGYLATGDELLTGENYIFGNYIPFNVNIFGVPNDPEVIKERYNVLLEQIDAARLEANILVPIADMGNNQYKCYDPQKKVTCRLIDYKTYHERHFAIWQDKKVVDITDTHVVFPLDEETYEFFMLPVLYPSWNKKMPWDEWMPRTEHQPVTKVVNILPPGKKQLYLNAIEKINKARTQNLGNEIAYAKLEERTLRLEQLIINPTPASVLEQEFKLIEKTLAVF